MGHRATHFFLIQSGRVRFYHLTKQGQLVLLAWLVPGDVVGLVALLTSPFAYMASAEATSDCELLVWNRSVIRKLTARYPLLGENGLHMALRYLRDYIDRHVGLVTKTAEERVQQLYLISGTNPTRFIPARFGSALPTINSEPWLMSARFTVTRVLRKWVRAGILYPKDAAKYPSPCSEALMID